MNPNAPPPSPTIHTHSAPSCSCAPLAAPQVQPPLVAGVKQRVYDPVCEGSDFLDQQLAWEVDLLVTHLMPDAWLGHEHDCDAACKLAWSQVCVHV